MFLTPFRPQISFLPMLLAIATVFAIGACASLPGGIDDAAVAAGAGERAAVAAPGRSLATMATYQYITIDAERTGVANVADDGRYTYLAFREAAPPGLELFDAEGEPLEAMVRQGRIAAVGGVHRAGILVRLRDEGGQPPGHSFIAPNPRAQASDLPELEADPELVEARSRLEHLTVQGPAFRRAIERAESRQRDGRRGGTAAAPWPSTATMTSLPVTAPERGAVDDPGFERTPRGHLIRVFFASGGRAIVRPDDGLARIEDEARRADEIHVAGYTDGIGSEAVNAGLARARAEAIQSLLVKRGIPPERIFVSWHGAGRYLADNATEQGRAMNRRVEVLFVRSSRGGQDRERYSAR